MDGTILGQGSFVTPVGTLTNPNAGSASQSNANSVIIQVPSGVDWLKVSNYTQYGTVGAAGGAYFNGTANADIGFEFFWQRGMAPGTGIVSYKASASAVSSVDTLATGGFTIYDPSGQTAGAQPSLSAGTNFTAITNVVRPVVSTASTAGLSVGSVVRLSPYLVNGTKGTAVINDLAGIDFVVGTVVSATSFTLLTTASEFANAPGITTGTGSWRIVNNPPLYYPRKLVVTDISQAVNPTVSTSTAHGLTPGQQLRFSIPAVSGMVQLNPTNANNYLSATVVSVTDAYDFVINVDTSGFNAFTYPTVAQQPSSFPEVVPFGENTASALASPYAQVPLDWSGNPIYNANTGYLADSTINTGYLGMILGIGGFGVEASAVPLIGPAGSISWSAGNVGTGDTIYWLAGKSTYGGL